VNLLYDIAPRLAELLLVAGDRPLTPEEEAELDVLAPALDDKVDHYCGQLRNLDALHAARQAEIDRLKAGQATLGNAAKRIKERLHVALQVAGLQGHRTGLFSIYRQANPPSVAWTGSDPAAIPEPFKRTRVEVTPDLKAVLDAVQAGGECPAGFEVRHGEHLRIK
jgi:hypothetical protein